MFRPRRSSRIKALARDAEPPAAAATAQSASPSVKPARAKRQAPVRGKKRAAEAPAPAKPTQPKKSRLSSKKRPAAKAKKAAAKGKKTVAPTTSQAAEQAGKARMGASKRPGGLLFVFAHGAGAGQSSTWMTYVSVSVRGPGGPRHTASKLHAWVVVDSLCLRCLCMHCSQWKDRLQDFGEVHAFDYPCGCTVFW